MRRRRRVSKKAFQVCFAAAAGFVVSSAKAQEITSTFSGNSGAWTDPTQWSTNPNYPSNGTPSGVEYDALINAPGTAAYTVSLSTSITTDSVTLNSPNATFSQTGGTLTTSALNVTAGTYSVTGGDIQNALITNSGGTFTATGNAGGHGSANTFNNVSLGSDLSVFGGLNVQNGINLNGHTLTYRSGGGIPFSYLDFQLGGSPFVLGNGTISLMNNTNGSGIMSGGSSGSTLTIANSATIEGSGTIDMPGPAETLVNQGVIVAMPTPDPTGLRVGAASFINTGLIETKGAGLIIQPAAATAWSNNGVLSLSGTEPQNTISAMQSLVFADGSAFSVVLGSAGQSGVLSISGSLDLSHNDSLDLSMAPGAVFSTPYEIASYTGGLTGTFTQVTSGFTVDYSQPGEILVTSVPEPLTGGYFLLCAGVVLVGRSRRRPQNQFPQ